MNDKIKRFKDKLNHLDRMLQGVTHPKAQELRKSVDVLKLILDKPIPDVYNHGEETSIVKVSKN